MTDKTTTHEAASISDGVNARPRNENIGQSAGGLPNDSSAPIEIDEAEAARIKDKLLGEAPEEEAEGHPS